MTDEKEPLLLKTGAAAESYSVDVGSKVSFENERIKCTWNDINVFVSDDSSGRFAFNLFGKDDLQRPKKHILKGVNGVAYPGELLAILGASGSGKTTLLNALTFRSAENVIVTGLRCCNGMPVVPNSLTSKCAYVQQDDLFMINLTVKEHLVFQALLRMDRDINYKTRMRRVDEVITEFGLTDCKSSRIGTYDCGGISGGERKRLSFASEILTDPSLMFCDEPTSGLDSFMALNVVQVLKHLTESGKTVITTIHQPSSEIYALFDKILLLAEGRVAFLGSRHEVRQFFESLESRCPKNYNPADYYINLLSVQSENEGASRGAIRAICDAFESSEIGLKTLREAGEFVRREIGYDIWQTNESHESPYKANWCAQFRAVLWRSWLNVIKESLLIKIRLMQTIMVAVMISVLYFGQEIDQTGVMNINGAIFMFLTSMTFQNVFAVINVFNAELQIFLREHRNGMYRTDVYFLCKSLAELPLFVLIPILFTAICYYSIGLNPEIVRYFIASGIVVLMTNAATSFGYLVSCASRNVSMALSIGPPLMIPFLILGGFILNLRSIPTYLTWISYLSWFRYAEEALMINQWSNVESINCTAPSSIVDGTCPRSGHVVLDVYGFQEGNLTFDVVSLAGLIVFYRTLAFVALLAKTFSNK